MLASNNRAPAPNPMMALTIPIKIIVPSKNSSLPKGETFSNSAVLLIFKKSFSKNYKINIFAAQNNVRNKRY
jgi:hypothetical protein